MGVLLFFCLLLDDKVGILDVKAKIDGHINCDIEMQVVNKKNIEKRILFYCSKMYIQSIKSGKDYSTAEKSIAILVSDYELDSLKDVKKYSSKWNFREEEYSNVILTDAIEVIIIELSKFEKYKNDTALASWVKFINNPKVKAKKVLDELSQDEHERRLAELREKYIMDQKATEAAGYDKGLEDGKKQGIEAGATVAKIEIAKEMKLQGYDNNAIQKLTGLSIKEIEDL